MGWAPATYTGVKIWGTRQYYAWFIHSYCKEELVRDPSNFGCCKGSLDSTLVMVRWSDACRLNAIGAGRRVQSWRGSRPGWCFGRTSTRPLHERVDRRLQTRGGAWTLADLWCAGGTKCNIMEYLFVCSTIDSNMKNHLHCYRYQRLKYKFNYTSLVKFSYLVSNEQLWTFIQSNL